MKKIAIILIFIPVLFFSQQKIIGIDSLSLKNTQDFFADDYGNLYLYKKNDFSFTKYDSIGNQLGKQMLTFPYKIQSITNPLNIVLFSENLQELRFLDQNLNDIQKINLSQKFGFVKCIYAEDLQFAWLIDDSNKTLIQYNFRNNTTINSVPFSTDNQSIIDFLVYNNKVYILRQNSFDVYNTKAQLLFSNPIDNGKKIKRVNNNILIISSGNIKNYDAESVKEIFSQPDSKIVDKNNVGFLAIIKDKLYLYKSKLKD